MSILLATGFPFRYTAAVNPLEYFQKRKVILRHTPLLILLFFLGACHTAMFSKPSSVESPFGVLVFLPWNDDWNNNMYTKDKAVRAMDLIHEAGLKWVRMDFSRTKIEPDTEGVFEFGQSDWLTGKLRARNISIVGILGYSPDWAASSNAGWKSAPKDVESFARYVYATVKRYQGKVDYWEIWNEPNLASYWEPQDDMAGYLDLLKASYKAARAANPGCHILNGGLSIMNTGDVERFYEKGAKNYFDIFNVHLFVGATGVPDIGERLVKTSQDIRGIMAKYGDGQKQLWVTEIGFHGVPEDALVKNGILKYKPREGQQAALLTKAFSAAIKSGKIDKIFWAFFQDTQNHFSDGADYYGLIRGDFTRKPAYDAYKKLIASFAVLP